ncbi:hypothetical protein ACEWY4_005620 [Coilia grayii]|uniref:Centrosomal protein kizuna n=1 Tax=Coilia grayii TaxID=363190 RepID=A0ABD1KJ47_9TELE
MGSCEYGNIYKHSSSFCGCRKRNRCVGELMAFCDDEYFEKIGHIQKNMHELEKKRLDLERELFTYCRSDQRVAQLKHAKLRRYLKEVSRKEEQAKARNLELLRSVEAAVSQADRFYPDLSSLHQMKAECWKQLSKLRENQEKQRAMLRNKNKDLPSSTQTLPPHQPSVIFMGRQSIRDPGADPVTSVLSPQLSHSAPNHRQQPLLPSGLLKDVCASKANVVPALSDDILDSIQLPDGTAPSGRHERSAPGVPSDCSFSARAAKAPTEASPQVTLKGPEMIAPSTAPQGLERSSPPLLSSHHSSSHNVPEAPSTSLQHETGDDTLNCSHEFVDLEKVPEEEVKSRSPSLSSSSVEISSDSSDKIDSYLSPSISDCDLQKSVKTKTSGQRLSKKSSALPEDRTPATLTQTALQDDSDQSSHSSAADRLSLDGLSYLLDHIEDRLQGGDKGPYHDLTVSQQKLSRVISLCRGKAAAALNGEALRACGAVAVQQLRRLSRSTSKGCLLPRELVGANWDCSERRAKIRSRLPADGVSLWERWLRHALLLRDLKVLSCEEILQVFTPALVQPDASYRDKAEVLLRALLNEPPLDVASTQSDHEDVSSAGLPSILGDSSDAQPAKPAMQRPVGLPTQGVQSVEEHSADQGSLESIPIRETKAYQLLKQSATQDQRWSSRADEEDEDEDEDHSSQEPQGSLVRGKHGGLEGGKNTSAQDSFRKEKTKAEAFTAVQSKAFWGESDDSNSDIEIALRPQSWKSGDDTDDFYD